MLINKWEENGQTLIVTLTNFIIETVLVRNSKEFINGDNKIPKSHVTKETWNTQLQQELIGKLEKLKKQEVSSGKALTDLILSR